ncbi:MAG: AAA family ATPase [Muribaculaceae bacterium]|nr:AAA family ATPase [Muribaculaceae bacterium]
MNIRIIRNRSEILWCTGLALLVPIWLGLAPMWYNWYSKKENGICLKRLYGLLDGCSLINIPICFVLLYVISRWSYKICKDQDFRLYRPILAVLGIVILFCKSQVTYAKIVGNYDYRWFLTFLFAVPLISVGIRLFCLLIGWIKRICTKKGFQTEETDCHFKGFTDDNTPMDDIPEALKNYAKEIVERLLETDITKHSFALGVTGEWGVGKTTFLGELKKKFEGRADIVEFNPWMCSSPEQVTNDFFASLRHQLSPKYSSLSNPIKEYARYIGNLTISSQSWASLDFLLFAKQESLYEKKKTLSQQFSKLPSPVVVIIDDVDRLERDEVFEVLRLIRNTADLSNMIYVVVYDKEYVTCVLEEKNIKDSSAYLEKIFPIEVHLPKVEEHLIWKALFAEIDAQSSLGKRFSINLFSKFESDDKELILRILDNYRRAKRFARLFMLNLAYLNQNSKGELKLLDVFWLELLQMYDKKSYDVLANDTNVLLYHYEDRFRVRGGILRPANKEDNNIFEGNPFWKEETPMILAKIFGEHIRTIRQSICYTENYDKYFTLSVSSFRLSIREMNELLGGKDTPYNIVKKWIDSGKYFKSIAYQFMQIPVYKLDDEQLKAYIQGLLCFAMIISPYRNNQIWEVKRKLWGELYSNGLEKKVHDIVLIWFEKEKSKADTKELLNLGRLLNRLYVITCIDEKGEQETIHGLVISNDEIKTLLVEMMSTYLIANPEFTALDVLTEKSDLAKMFKSCCINVRDSIAYDNSCEYKQLAYDAVIEHFASKKDKPTLGEFEKAYGSLFSQEVPVFDNPVDEDYYWDYLSEEYDNNMLEYFGSSYGKKENNKLEEFKNRCFVKEKGEEEEKSPAKTIETAEIQGQRTKPIQQAKKKKKGNK